MATVGTNYFTLKDYASRVVNRKIQPVVEVIADAMPIVDDIIWREGNLATGHRGVIRSGLPTGTWRQLNYGTQPEVSTAVPITDTCGILEGYSDIDQDIAELERNTAAVRSSEDKAFVEGLTQNFVNTLFTGNTGTDPERFMGLRPRYNDTNADSATNVIDGGSLAGQTDNLEIWLVTWGQGFTHGIFPKGSVAGLQHTDKGLTTKYDSNSNPFEVYRSHWKWKCGLHVADWRYNVRIANIDESLLVNDAATGPDIIDLMIRAIWKLFNPEKGKKVFYVGRTIGSFLDRQTLNQSQMNVTYSMDPHGKRVMMFRGIPVRVCDVLDTYVARYA
jgi:hypothetical protein